MKRDQHNNPNFLFCHHCPTPPDPTGSLLHLNQHVMNHILPSSHCFCLAERGQGDGRPCRITEPSKRPLKCSPPPPPPPLKLPPSQLPNMHEAPPSLPFPSPSRLLYHPLHRGERFDADVLQWLQKQTNNFFTLTRPSHHDSVTASHFHPITTLIQRIID